jgi:hypothetical protein
MELQSPTLEIVYRMPGYATLNMTKAPIDAMAESMQQYAAKIYVHLRFVERDDRTLK